MEKQARTVLLTTAALLAVMLGWSLKNRAPEAVQVRAGTASVQDIYNSVSVPGSVEAAQSTAVCPAENAVVTGVYAAVGDYVEQGEVLCTLSESAAENAGANDLKTVWKSFSDTTGQTVIAQGKNALCAPQAGTVLSLPAEGETVLANLPCAGIADLGSLQVRAQTPEIYAGDLKAGQLVNVTATAAGDAIYAAVVGSVAPVASRAVSLTGESGSATVEAVLPLRGRIEGLRPGYSVTAKIFTDYHPDAVVVPFEAVCQRGEQEYVYCIENGKAVQRAVTTGYMLENVTEITEGLAGGETVILSPEDGLADGAAVEVRA